MSTVDRQGDTGGAPVPVERLSYTEASRELDAIVDFFEQRDVDVDQLVARLERATAIVDELDRRIRQTKSHVEELAPRLEAAARAVTGDDEARAASRAAGRSGPADEADEDDEDELFEDEAIADQDLDEESELWDEDDEDAGGGSDGGNDQPLF